ncbi:MAG: oxygenase MpaB family protein [Actinomycetota bacterium]
MQTTLVRGLGDVVRGFPRPPPGRNGDPGLFGPGSLAWRINAESVLLLGGGRALLMQAAHPLVAAGVADHSDFTADPFDRLWRTVDAALTVIFGDLAQSRAAVERVSEVHTRVRGERDGISYSALDPELLLWVHATLVDSSIAAYDRFVRPLPPEIRERYYLEMRRMGTAFGVPEDLHPPTYAHFRTYLRRTVSALEIGDESRLVARQVLSPPMPLLLFPAGITSGLLAVGLLPPAIRSGLRLRWNAGTERAFVAGAAVVRSTLPVLPDRIRRWPHARQAEHRMTRS